MKVWKRNLEKKMKTSNIWLFWEKETTENEEKDKTFKKSPELKKDINA